MMKTFDLKSLLLGVSITMVIVVVMLIATSSNTPAASEYQYHVMSQIHFGPTFENRLNSAAKDGWEVIDAGMDKNDYAFAVLRRVGAVQRPAWWKSWKK